MDREFLELYNRELRILKEQAKEFAEEYPGVAERLGGLLDNNMDPMIGGLLEGTAFLASRVQLKLQHEYSEFTNNLLDQLVPDYLAPVPSVTLLRIEPPFAEPNLKDGMTIASGSYTEARFVERERRIACKYRLASDIELWPFELGAAEFVPSAASLQGLGIDSTLGAQSGLRLSLIKRSVARREDEPTEKQVAKKSESWTSKCRTKKLTFHIVCAEADATRICEKIFGHTSSIHIRYLNELGDAVVRPIPRDELLQVGFAEDEALFPIENRMFSGFELLREYFIFPQKFLAFTIKGLERILPEINTNKFEIVFAFDQPDSKLQTIIRADSFALYAAPAINLFEMQVARVPIKANEHEHHIVTDRSRHLDFEAHRILKVFAHFSGTTEKTEVLPLYASSAWQAASRNLLFYTQRRLPRRRSEKERRFGETSGYVGTDMFLTLGNHLARQDEKRVSELSVRALCSNRHLTEHLPVGQGGADFILEEKTNLKVLCIAGPTLPRDSIVMKAKAPGQTEIGTSAWKLISLLSLNHLGLTGRGTDDSAAALRELLSLFADLNDASTERRLRGIISVESRPINRRIRQKAGAGVVRGLAITITFDEKAYEGSGIFLIGAVLDRFFVEYIGVNNVVQTVVKSVERGVIMQWPPRMGRRIEL